MNRLDEVFISYIIEIFKVEVDISLYIEEETLISCYSSTVFSSKKRKCKSETIIWSPLELKYDHMHFWSFPNNCKVILENPLWSFRMSWIQWLSPSRLCFLLICQRNQNKTQIYSPKIDFFVSRAKFQALIINLHCMQPIDFWPVIK